MKRAGRWLFNLSATMCDIIGIAGAGLMILSHYYMGALAIRDLKGNLCAISEGFGVVRLAYAHSSPPQDSWPAHSRDRVAWEWRPTSAFLNEGFTRKDFAGGSIPSICPADWFKWELAGLSITKFTELDHVGSRQVSQLIVPIWMIVLLAAAMPGFYCFRLLRARRMTRRGICTACGYDLRATPERCPECGAVPSTSTRAMT